MSVNEDDIEPRLPLYRVQINFIGADDQATLDQTMQILADHGEELGLTYDWAVIVPVDDGSADEPEWPSGLPAPRLPSP